MKIKDIENLWVLAVQYTDSTGYWRMLYLNEEGLFDVFENAKLFHSTDRLFSVVSEKHSHALLFWTTYQLACGYQFQPIAVG